MIITVMDKVILKLIIGVFISVIHSLSFLVFIRVANQRDDIFHFY
jgi:hypothetical protein